MGAFLLGLATNQDVCVIASLVLFFMGLLLTVAWARTSTAARWLLAGMLGLTLLIGVSYFMFLLHRASVKEKYMKMEIKMVPVQKTESLPIDHSQIGE